VKYLLKINVELSHGQTKSKAIELTSKGLFKNYIMQREEEGGLP
jgi:hypothetical protein